MAQPPVYHTDPDEFEDPLENYEPKTYNDPLEQALAEETVEAIQSAPYASVTSDTLVSDAIRKLAGLRVSCLLVNDGPKLAGIFSHRDILDKVALDYDAVKGKPVSAVMTSQPVFVCDTDSAAAALSVMAVSGYRHVPVLTLDKAIVGIVSPQRIAEFLRRHFE